MIPNKYSQSILATHSITNKTENQDAQGVFESKEFNSVYVADGLGSFKYAQAASGTVVDSFHETDKNHSSARQLNFDFKDIFLKAKQKVIELSQTEQYKNEKGEQNLFGTTAIKLCESAHHLSVAYVGNGAIWHFRPNFTEFPPNYYFPWCIINYLNPHTIPENGKEALYRLISEGEDSDESIPSVMEIHKDGFLGDIVVICTDGLHSADQVRMGKNEKGVWTKMNELVCKLYECLAHFFRSSQLYSSETLKQELVLYMEVIKKDIADDVTIGILITAEALNYQAKVNAKL
jgi:PPM family protein phosphatase